MRREKLATIIIAILLIISCCVVFSSCGLDKGTNESFDNSPTNTTSFDNNVNDSITTWDNANIDYWDDPAGSVKYYVESTILMDNAATEFPYVECDVLDFKSNGVYFDENIIKNQIGDFDLNGLLTKFAIGTGVILVVVLLDVATMGTPIACFIAGAAKGAIKEATIGAAMGAATSMITTAVKTGDWNQSMVKSIEGSVDGYMWGAIYGAITGGLSSKYCFKAGTKVKTAIGYESIENIKRGDYVWTYSEEKNQNELVRVTNTYTNSTSVFTHLTVGVETIFTTPGHKIFNGEKYLPAGDLLVGESVKTFYGMANVAEIHTDKSEYAESVYNFEVEKNHNYYVGYSEILVHNRNCINQDYAGKTYKFESQLEKALNESDPARKKELMEVYNNLCAKYPDGVPFSQLVNGRTSAIFDNYIPIGKDGKPLKETFDAISKETLEKGTCLVGDSKGSSSDFKKFWDRLRKRGYTNEEIATLKDQYAVHHDPDMRTLELVPKDLHEAVRHTGGASFIWDEFRALLESFGYAR